MNSWFHCKVNNFLENFKCLTYSYIQLYIYLLIYIYILKACLSSAMTDQGIVALEISKCHFVSSVFLFCNDDESGSFYRIKRFNKQAFLLCTTAQDTSWDGLRKLLNKTKPLSLAQSSKLLHLANNLSYQVRANECKYECAQIDIFRSGTWDLV